MRSDITYRGEYMNFAQTLRAVINSGLKPEYISLHLLTTGKREELTIPIDITDRQIWLLTLRILWNKHSIIYICPRRRNLVSGLAVLIIHNNRLIHNYSRCTLLWHLLKNIRNPLSEFTEEVLPLTEITLRDLHPNAEYVALHIT